MRRRTFVPALFVVAALGAAACSSGSDGAAPTSTARPGSTTTTVPAVEPSASAAAAGQAHDRCDPITGTVDGAPPPSGTGCPLPFPNDWFTIADSKTDTGLRVALPTALMPANTGGVHIDMTEQNRNDGFSPGQALLVDLPGLDLAKTGAAPITDIGASLADDAPIVLVDTATGKRHPYWAELDGNATADASPLLLIHPATNFLEGHRYAVGLRNLRDAAGKAIAGPSDFRLLRDRAHTGDATLEARRAGIEQVFDGLSTAGVDRGDLALAWDFTIASQRSLSERLLHMRDDAFAALGDEAPKFTVTSSVDAADGPTLRTVKGTFEVPRYLTGDGAPGTVLNNGDGTDDPLPTRNGTQTANFDCVVPRSAVSADGAAVPTRMSLYGHGLLGDAGQVEGVGSAFSTVSNTTFCATDWSGMASEDTGNVVKILGDLSTFRSLADRLQQGILNFLFLGRLMKSPKGLTTDKAFQDARGGALLDHEHLVFVGLSEGGILGGVTTAVAGDWSRAMLGVPGANYSLLLNRSVDFDEFGAILTPAYPRAADRQVALQLIQMLWDRGENDGYLQHFSSDPYPGTGTEAKQYLLFEAFGDHQVTNISTEVMARSIGAELRAPGLRPGRATAKVPFWGITPIRKLPASGRSYLVVWDFGTPAPPVANLPNRAGDDPHGKGRDDPKVLRMATTFLDEGRLEDPCAGQPCVTLDG